MNCNKRSLTDKQRVYLIGGLHYYNDIMMCHLDLSPFCGKQYTSKMFSPSCMDRAKRKTPSYEKHFLTHTDITAGGHGYTCKILFFFWRLYISRLTLSSSSRSVDPHRKTFDWNLLFLKQSWGTKPKPRSANQHDDTKLVNHSLNLFPNLTTNRNTLEAENTKPTTVVYI